MNVTINGVDYYYEVYGEGEPLLLLHGFTGSGVAWNPFIKQWSENKKIINVDIIGHGRTSSPDDDTRYDIELVAKDLIELLDVLGIDKVNILGYSMGGRLAIAMSILYGERINSLILESTSAGIISDIEREERRVKDDLLANSIEANGIEQFVLYWEQIPLFDSNKNLPENTQTNIRRERMKRNPVGLANSLRGMGTGAHRSYWEELNQVIAPVLIICGELDKKFCLIAEQLKNRMPQTEIKIISHCGHAVHVENPVNFGTMVEEWI